MHYYELRQQICMLIQIEIKKFKHPTPYTRTKDANMNFKFNLISELPVSATTPSLGFGIFTISKCKSNRKFNPKEI